MTRWKVFVMLLVLGMMCGADCLPDNYWSGVAGSAVSSALTSGANLVFTQPARYVTGLLGVGIQQLPWPGPFMPAVGLWLQNDPAFNIWWLGPTF